jgi:Protein of unknown function (DUF1275)
MTTPTRSDPLPWVLVVLTVTTGLVDAVSVLGLGRVFTANITGNVVFLGFAAVGVPGFSIARAVVALAGFVVGALLGGYLGVAMAGVARRRSWSPVRVACSSPSPTPRIRRHRRSRVTCINDHGGNGNVTHDRAGELRALLRRPVPAGDTTQQGP